MTEVKNLKEEKQAKKRVSYSLFFSVIFHFSLLLSVSLCSRKEPPPEKVVVMKVTLSEPVRVGSESGAAPQAAAQSSQSQAARQSGRTQPQRPVVERITETVRKTVSETPGKTEPVKATVKENPVTESKPAVKSEREPDLIQKALEENLAEQKQLEEQFFRTNEKQGKSEKLPELGDLDSLLSGIIDGAGRESTNNTGKSGDGGGSGDNIKWGDGGTRRLRHSTSIELPDEIKNAGLKFRVEISFTVMSDGIISSSNIIRSSGNAVWDEIIRTQFSRWTFERSSRGTSTGVISIEIGY